MNKKSKHVTHITSIRMSEMNENKIARWIGMCSHILSNLLHRPTTRMRTCRKRRKNLNNWRSTSRTDYFSVSFDVKAIHHRDLTLIRRVHSAFKTNSVSRIVTIVHDQTESRYCIVIVCVVWNSLERETHSILYRLQSMLWLNWCWYVFIVRPPLTHQLLNKWVWDNIHREPHNTRSIVYVRWSWCVDVNSLVSR